MRKGSTWDEFTNGDISYLFRRQSKRSLYEIDTLLERQAFLRKKLGRDKADSIEADPDFYYNHERFRIWQAQARFRAILTTLLVCPVVLVTANNFKDGWGFMTKRWYVSAPFIIGTFVISFYAWHRFVGYNNEVYMEQSYAKNVKMLRNLIIKQ